MRRGVLAIVKSEETSEAATASRADSAGKTWPDLIERLQAATETLHSAELQVARAILDDPDWVSRSSIKALAERAKVSEPTIIRLSRKLGCTGYSEFKLRLAQDLIVTRMFLTADRVVQDSEPDSIAERMFAAANRSMGDARSMLDAAALEQAAGLIARAGRVLCFGVGGSSAVLAQEAENRLFRLGIATTPTADAYKQRMAVAIMAKGDVLLCFSATGRPDTLIESARMAREKGAAVLVIAPADSELAKHATITLAINVFNDELYFNLPSPIRYAQLFLLDCLAAAVVVELGSSSVQKLKNIRRTLSDLHGTVRFQPIGD